MQGDSNEPDRRWVNLLKNQIQAAEVELVAELAHADATVEQLLAFKPWATSSSSTSSANIHPRQVVGVPVFECHYGTSSGKYALKVERMLTGSNMTGWEKAMSAENKTTPPSRTRWRPRERQRSPNPSRRGAVEAATEVQPEQVAPAGFASARRPRRRTPATTST